MFHSSETNFRPGHLSTHMERLWATPSTFQWGQVRDKFDLIHLFFDTFEDMKTEMFLVKRKNQVLKTRFLSL